MKDNGFTKVGEVPQMFRIDGQLISAITMASRLRDQPAAVGDSASSC